MEIKFAEKCAWRAVYVSRELSDSYGRHQFFHIGIDPTIGSGPACFGAISNPWVRGAPKNRFRFHISWRFKLPTIQWKYNAGPLRRWAYLKVAGFWHRMDGRFQGNS